MLNCNIGLTAESIEVLLYMSFFFLLWRHPKLNISVDADDVKLLHVLPLKTVITPHRQVF